MDPENLTETFNMIATSKATMESKLGQKSLAKQITTMEKLTIFKT
jgi:hypothetical protein